MNTYCNPDIQAQLFAARRDDLLREAAQRRLLANLAQDGQRSEHCASREWRIMRLALPLIPMLRSALAAIRSGSR